MAFAHTEKTRKEWVWVEKSNSSVCGRLNLKCPLDATWKWQEEIGHTNLRLMDEARARRIRLRVIRVQFIFKTTGPEGIIYGGSDIDKRRWPGR